MGSSVPAFHDSDPKLTISGTMVMPHSAATSSGMSDAESVTIATLATGCCGGLRGDAFERHRDRSPATKAECRQSIPSLTPVQFMKQGRDYARAARADRMPERDRTAVDVDLRPVEPELAPIRQRLGGERLVDLDQVERFDWQLDLGEELADTL